jgi:shikimate dehydrogenase
MDAHASHVVGLIGGDIGSSLSPSLHEREADELGLRYVYERIDIRALGLPVARIGELVRSARQLGYRGLNITRPCKHEVVRHVDGLSPDATMLDAVNTVVFRGAHAVGYHTGWLAFQEGFVRRLPDVATRSVVLVGAGAAGAAVAHAALSLGVERITVVDVDPERADALVTSLRARHGHDRAAGSAHLGVELAAADGLVRATPTGMPNQPGMSFAAEHLHEALWVADLVYRPLETELVRLARRLGCRTLSGAEIAVFKAAISFALFTGIQPDRDRMLRHLAALVRDDPPVAASPEPR